jgi:menaquinone-dependent protoporphyrinogen oxidase
MAKEAALRILVAVASKHGSTQEIAEAIATRLRETGHVAELASVTTVADVSGYDAFVVGGASYIGRWLPEATEFVRRNAGVLAARPTWLFSSGPLAPELPDGERGAQLIAAEPKEIAELAELVHARGHRVFFGSLDPAKLGLRDRAIRALPAGRSLLSEGDFRNLDDLEAWADRIARELTWEPETPPAE